MPGANERSKCVEGRLMFHTYIVECSDGSFYVGHTQSLTARIQDHNAGKGALHTRVHGHVRLVYSEIHASELVAIDRELQIKKWSRAKKKALIDGNKNRLHELSKSRD
jgi:predicted GIY-YIG superfamily endonuclease